jgi:AraC family transcriptional regulator
MHPRIELLGEKKLVGHRIQMSFAHNETPNLWRGFMPKRNLIKHSCGTDLISMQIYSPNFFNPFDPHKTFTKWATTEVSSFEDLPEGLETVILPSGLYAVFAYKGSYENAADTFQQILGLWLPNSSYWLDDRPHFEIIGEKYKNGHPDSEEEIWIPVCEKT